MYNTVRQLRMRKGLTQQMLASWAEVPANTLWAVEHNRSIPRVDTALRIAGALGVRVEDVFFL